MVFGEQVFAGESLMCAPADPGRTLTVPLAPARDAPVALMIKALVGARVSARRHPGDALERRSLTARATAGTHGSRAGRRAPRRLRQRAAGCSSAAN